MPTPLALSVLLFACALPHATAQVQDKKAAAPKSPWSLSMGLGVARSAEYEGGKRSVTGVIPDLNVSYKTDGWGTIALGSKARGLTWNFIEAEHYGLGLILQGDAGRVAGKDGSLLRPGGKRLAGLGEIRPTPEFGVTGNALLGLPFYFVLTRGTGTGKPTANGNGLRINGHGGTRFELGSELPWKLTSALTLSISPSVIWADSTYTQAYFGITAQQAAQSGFRPYTAKGGIKSAGLSLGANYQFDKHWSANVGASFSTLRGDAAKSPIVEKKSQTGIATGFLYTF